MAKTYTSTLTAEQCRDMLIQLLKLDDTATDEEITSAFDEEMGEDATAQEPEGAAEPAAPAEEQMPPKAGPSKFRGSAMTVLVRPKK